MSRSYRESWPLPDPFLIELGRVGALWASLESFLNLCLGKLAGFQDLKSPVPFILVNHSSFPQRLDMLGALCEELKDEFPELGDYKVAIAKLKAAQTLRNKYAHNGISFDPERNGYFLAQGSARGKVKTSVEPVTPDDIHQASREVHLAQLALYKLILGQDPAPIWERPSNA